MFEKRRHMSIPASAGSAINTAIFRIPSEKPSTWLSKTPFVDKYQMFWFFTHINTLFGFSMYTIWLFNRKTPFFAFVPWYKLTNISCILTYSIVIYKRYLCKDRIDQDEINGNILISYILKTENVQLIICSILWTATNESIFKLIPFAVYSILNVIFFFVFEAYPKSTFSVAVAPFICYIKDPSLVFSAFIDILIIGILLKESYTNRSYYAFFLYTFIWGLKIENSEASRIAITKMVETINPVLMNPYVPQKIQQFWCDFNSSLGQLLSISTATAVELPKVELSSATIGNSYKETRSKGKNM